MRAVSGETVVTLSAIGTADDVAARISALRKAGLKQAVLFPLTVDGDASGAIPRTIEGLSWVEAFQRRPRSALGHERTSLLHLRSMPALPLKADNAPRAPGHSRLRPRLRPRYGDIQSSVAVTPPLLSVTSIF